MLDWFWLSRIVMLGVAGTAALATWFTSLLGQSEHHNSSNSVADVPQGTDKSKRTTRQ